MGGYFLFVGSNLEKYGKFWKNSLFSGRIWPDWGNTAWADMAGLGSIGLYYRPPCWLVDLADLTLQGHFQYPLPHLYFHRLSPPLCVSLYPVLV